MILYVNPNSGDINDIFNCDYNQEWLCPQRQLNDTVKRVYIYFFYILYIYLYITT